ncbi:AAA family ATPase, partial [Bacteroides mediterraneensis]|nr:AAA family ATPase [Bacteroides mediterraneensis]
MSKLYPVGVQNFEKVILGGYEYVDKTALIYELFNTGSYYFLSRPRRFGKSLLLSTLEAYAQGKKELFKGLALEILERDWTVYPVLHMDLNTEKYDTKASLENKLELTLKQWEGEYGYNPDEYSVATRFEGVIRRACEQTGRRVVILIDEYDKPMLQAIGNEALQNEYRSTLKAFYGALKSMDGCIRFALLTGVTKFGKVSVFSDLNNLMDISMDDRYVEICGISEKEVHACFEEDIHALATATGLTYEETYAELKANYDGYHFTENAVGMYNPFSL